MTEYSVYLRPDEVKEIVRLDLKISRLKRLMARRQAKRAKLLASARRRKYRSGQ